MARWLVVTVFLFGFSPPAIRAERFNGVNLEEAQAKVECLNIRFQDAGHPDIPHLDRQYFLRLKVENATNEPCVVDPKRFRIVDPNKKEFNAQEVFIRYRQVDEEQSETMRPGDSWDYAIVFGEVRLDSSRPSLLYYKDVLLGELTR